MPGKHPTGSASVSLLKLPYTYKATNPKDTEDENLRTQGLK